MLNLTVKICDIIKNKKVSANVDPYDVIELILHILFVLYMQNNKKYDVELANTSVEQILNIIKMAVALLKMTGIKVEKKSCFDCIFK